MSRPVARYRPSRRYTLLALIALIGAGASVAVGLRWSLDGWSLISYFVAGAFLVTAGGLLLFASRPSIEIHESHLKLGKRLIAWNEVRGVDQTEWTSPLAVRLTIEGQEPFLLVYPGDPDSCGSLLRQIRRYSRQAMIDGIPYRQFWGEPPARKEIAPPRYRLLRPEDEQEVENMFRRLKSEGRLDAHAPDEKIGEK